MNTRIKYLEKPYSLENYRKIIRLLAEEGYKFAPFDIPEVKGKTVFLRHDIDYSLHWAEQLASENNKLNARGTFFFQLRCGLYNLFSHESAGILRRISAYNQYIGFHLHLGPEHDTCEKIASLLESDYSIFKTLIPQSRPVFAWHNPGIAFEKNKQLMDKDFEGFVNVYGQFAGGKFPYYSDSNMRYEVADLKTIVQKGEIAFQLALAPMQWLPGHNNMVSVMIDALMRKVKDMDREFFTNDVYREVFPEGLPVELLKRLETEIHNYLEKRK